jgi:hypothetical protein
VTRRAACRVPRPARAARTGARTDAGHAPARSVQRGWDRSSSHGDGGRGHRRHLMPSRPCARTMLNGGAGAVWLARARTAREAQARTARRPPPRRRPRTTASRSCTGSTGSTATSQTRPSGGRRRRRHSRPSSATSWARSVACRSGTGTAAVRASARRPGWPRTTGAGL